MTDRALAGVGAGAGPGGGSLTKLAWSRAEQDLASLAVDAVGLAGLAGLAGAESPWGHFLSSARQASIAGGTTEINHNIVAEHALGLPR
jgi:alkylation response protein AidB-like acyl-CoA dehydrogenase